MHAGTYTCSCSLYTHIHVHVHTHTHFKISLRSKYSKFKVILSLFSLFFSIFLFYVLIVLWRCLRGLTGEGFLTFRTVFNRICWLLLDFPDLPAANHYNVYVLFIHDIDYDVY